MYEHSTPGKHETDSPVRLTYDEYFSQDHLPTPFDPSVYGDDFSKRLRHDLLSSTNLEVAEQIDIHYPYRDAAMRAVLKEVDFQLDHRATHNEERHRMIQEYLESGEIDPDPLFDTIIEKMNYGTHDAAEAGYILTSLPEEFDGIEVKKFTKFGMSLKDYHVEAYKTLGAFHRASYNRPELGVSDISCNGHMHESYKEIPVQGAAPIGVFKQPLAVCIQNGTAIELMTRGSYVTLPHRNASPEHKIISLQQYVRRYRPESHTSNAERSMAHIALADIEAR